MSTQLSKAPSIPQTAYETALRTISVEKILKEQSDEAAVITILVGQVKRLIRLYQIPNIERGADIELADWIYENYKWEPFNLVYSVLNNPPATGEKNWRLTPDTIREWMSEALEREAVKRENEHYRLKWSDKDWKLQCDDKELEAIYERLKMPARITELAREDMAELKKVRFSPQTKFTCEGYDIEGQHWTVEVYAIDGIYAARSFKEAFGKDPDRVEKSEPQNKQ